MSTHSPITPHLHYILVKMQAEPGNQAELHLLECLLDVLRFTDHQIQVLQGNGYAVAEDLAYWSYEEIPNWVSHSKEKLRANIGASSYGHMKRKSLIALTWWVAKKVRTGAVIDLDEFDDQACHEAIVESKVKYEAAKGELSIDKPEKFKSEDWPEWEKSIYMYLYLIDNSIGMPLVYVNRKDTFIRGLDVRDQAIMHQ
jgi:hypothetical protein